jgi:ribosomal protein S26
MGGENDSMNCAEVVFSGHAVQRMFARGLNEADILQVIRQGEIIESYPHDTPYPSKLLLGVSRGVIIHAVVARRDDRRCIVVTAYVPDPQRWNTDFKTRRQP